MAKYDLEPISPLTPAVYDGNDYFTLTPTVIMWLDIEDRTYLLEWNFITHEPDHEDSFEFRVKSVPGSTDYTIVLFLALPVPPF